jgi:hypothetical protein
LLRVAIAGSNEVQGITLYTAKGTALKSANVIYEAGKAFAYFTAEGVGVAQVSMQWRIVGQSSDGGFVSSPLRVIP